MKNNPFILAFCLCCFGAISLFGASEGVPVTSGSRVVPAAATVVYPDGRPSPKYRLEARDQGVILRHGDGPGGCDKLGAREALVFEEDGTYHLFYDGAGPKGWLACLATSNDLKTWAKKGPILDFGKPGENDSASAASPWVFSDGRNWHMFYLATPNTSPAPNRLAVFYDAPGGDSTSHMGRDLGLAWLDLPLVPP